MSENDPTADREDPGERADPAAAGGPQRDPEELQTDPADPAEPADPEAPGRGVATGEPPAEPNEPA